MKAGWRPGVELIDPEPDEFGHSQACGKARCSIARSRKDHVHFLVQSVPMYSVKKIVQVIKSITAREVFRRCPQVKTRLWGGEFWSDGYFASTVGKHGDEAKIGKYVQSQGQEYEKLHEDRQLSLF